MCFGYIEKTYSEKYIYFKKNFSINAIKKSFFHFDIMNKITYKFSKINIFNIIINMDFFYKVI